MNLIFKIFRTKDQAAIKKQVSDLFVLVDEMVGSNGGGCYTNELYKKAEAELKKIEEEERLKAEAKKKEEVDRIKAECKVDMQQQIDKLEKDHEIRMSEMREHLRRDVADRNDGYFARIGDALDKILEPVKDLIKSGVQKLLNKFQ